MQNNTGYNDHQARAAAASIFTIADQLRDGTWNSQQAFDEWNEAEKQRRLYNKRVLAWYTVVAICGGVMGALGFVVSLVAVGAAAIGFKVGEFSAEAVVKVARGLRNGGGWLKAKVKAVRNA